MKTLCSNQKEPRKNFITIKAVTLFSKHRCICSINSFFRVIFLSTKIVDLGDITSQNNKLKANLRLKSSAWEPSHFKAVLQLAPDSMLKFSLPYQSGLSYNKFYSSQIFFCFIYGAFYLNLFTQKANSEKSFTLSEEH